MYLLDTGVISELRKPRPHGGVLAWLHSTADADLHVSAVTIGEIQAGIELPREQDAAKAVEIEAWLELVAQAYSVMPMDGATFRAWARLMHRRSDTLVEDAMIAVTATVRPELEIPINLHAPFLAPQALGNKGQHQRIQRDAF